MQIEQDCRSKTKPDSFILFFVKKHQKGIRNHSFIRYNKTLNIQISTL
jgi:hypothetical protein